MSCEGQEFASVSVCNRMPVLFFFMNSLFGMVVVKLNQGGIIETYTFIGSYRPTYKNVFFHWFIQTVSHVTSHEVYEWAT